MIEQARAQLLVLEKSYFPRFFLQGSAYSRGTGAELNGARLGGANGLAPNVQNYALGFTVTFPVADRASIRAKQAGQSATVRAEEARATHRLAQPRSPSVARSDRGRRPPPSMAPSRRRLRETVCCASFFRAEILVSCL